ncbi:MAG: class II glutamine amidotransferase [Clostridiales Family XIII bacterium]|jgi:glutamine amidotransferase|nr:class II glutamine amidotransferase [Clostridiales Family XIII bacterium]
MCQLFAVSASEKIEINKELGRFIENSRLHRHGWGYADFSARRVRERRETGPAYESAYLKEKLSGPFCVSNAFFHIRYATVGDIKIENTHPFMALDMAGRTWSIVHNGTIFDGSALDEYFSRQAGDTDTERLLIYLISCVNRRQASCRTLLTDAQRFEIVEAALMAIVPHNKLNVVISDSEIVYVHGNSRSGSRLLGEAVRNDYIYELDLGTAKLFCTFKIDGRDWRPIPLNTVLAYGHGELLYAGEPHGFEYLESDADTHDMYRDFSYL